MLKLELFHGGPTNILLKNRMGPSRFELEYQAPKARRIDQATPRPLCGLRRFGENIESLPKYFTIWFLRVIMIFKTAFEKNY
jgi:hypothetical protein